MGHGNFCGYLPTSPHGDSKVWRSQGRALREVKQVTENLRRTRDMVKPTETSILAAFGRLIEEGHNLVHDVKVRSALSIRVNKPFMPLHCNSGLGFVAWLYPLAIGCIA